jgi:hypothetical protein
MHLSRIAYLLNSMRFRSCGTLLFHNRRLLNPDTEPGRSKLQQNFQAFKRQFDADVECSEDAFIKAVKTLRDVWETFQTQKRHRPRGIVPRRLEPDLWAEVLPEQSMDIDREFSVVSDADLQRAASNAGDAVDYILFISDVESVTAT